MVELETQKRAEYWNLQQTIADIDFAACEKVVRITAYKYQEWSLKSLLKTQMNSQKSIT